MRISDLRQLLRDLGAGARHEQHLMRVWAQRLPIASKRRPLEFLPLSVRAGLAEWQARLDGLVRLQSAHASSDGGERLLLALADGQAIESVLLPQGGVCVSSQVGCAVGCVFCMTGQGGLIRQVGSAEIAAQVVFARSRVSVDKVVFMGMGEPAHNLDNVMEAIDWLGTSGAIGHKNLVFSTVGDARVFERLPQGPVKPALALSLHSTRPELRAELLPRAPRIDPADLVGQAERYARATGYPVQYQWTLIEGVNDGDDEVDALGRLLAGKYARDEFHSVQRGRRPVMASTFVGPMHRDRGPADAPRRADQVASIGRAGRRRRLRPVACARPATRHDPDRTRSLNAAASVIVAVVVVVRPEGFNGSRIRPAPGSPARALPPSTSGPNP